MTENHTETQIEDQTITWDDGFTPYSAVIADGVLTEFRGTDTALGTWTMTRAPHLDNDENIAVNDLLADDCEYSCGPASTGDMTAWIDGKAYALIDVA